MEAEPGDRAGSLLDWNARRRPAHRARGQRASRAHRGPEAFGPPAFFMGHGWPPKSAWPLETPTAKLTDFIHV